MITQKKFERNVLTDLCRWAELDINAHDLNEREKVNMVNGVDRDEEIIIYILHHCIFCIGVTLQRFKLRSYNFLWLLTACAHCLQIWIM